MTDVVVVGLGPIGQAVLRLVAKRSGLVLAGAVDVAPEKAGKDAGVLAGLAPLGVPVCASLADLAPRRAVAALCTGSSLASVEPQLETLIAAGCPVVSTCEELAYPWHTQPALAERLDRRAKAAGVAILGTGVNPGFAMDVLPIVLSAACAEVHAVRVSRLQDAGRRRLPFQVKIGAGLTVEEFDARRRAGVLGHVGLAESIGMIADALGWRLEAVRDAVRPQVAAQAVASPQLRVPAGRVAGLIQDGVGVVGGVERIFLHMEAYLGCPESYDEVHLEGTPPLRMRLEGGLPGDLVTAAVVVNSVVRLAAAPPGLHTMRSLPLPSFATGEYRR